MEYNIIKTKKIEVYSIRQTMNIEEFDKYFDLLFKNIQQLNLTITDPPRAIYHTTSINCEKTPNMDIELAIPVIKKENITKTIDQTLCVMTTHIGAYTGLPKVYQNLGTWVEKNNYEISDSPYEVYVSNPREIPIEECVTEVYFPIKAL